MSDYPISFKQRSNHPELMDDLSLEGKELKQNLDELEVINFYLGGNKVLTNGLDYLLKQHPEMAKNEITLADLGSGGGDGLRSMAKWAQKKDLNFRFTGFDANPFMVSYARNRSRAYSEINYETKDIFSPEFKEQKFDVLTCSLFCHHFSDEELITIFRQWKQQARVGVIINDLHRHPLAFHSIRLITQMAKGSRLVQHDAPLSVLRAFKQKELKNILHSAGIKEFRFRWMWAFRYQIIF